jgi:hypothetical protein
MRTEKSTLHGLFVINKHYHAFNVTRKERGIAMNTVHKNAINDERKSLTLKLPLLLP